MQQNNESIKQTKQDDFLEFSEFDMDMGSSNDALSSAAELKQVDTTASTLDTAQSSVPALSSDDSGLLEFDIDESLLEQFNNPEPTVVDTPQSVNQPAQDIDKLFEDIPLNQPAQQSPTMQAQPLAGSQSMDTNPLDLEFDLQNELHDSDLSSDLTAHSVGNSAMTANDDINTLNSELGMSTNPHADPSLNDSNLSLTDSTASQAQSPTQDTMLGNDFNNHSINQNSMNQSAIFNNELSLAVDEPVIGQNQLNNQQQPTSQFEQMPSVGQAQSNSYQQGDGLFNLPVDENENMGTHLGQSVGTIKARPLEDNPYAASNRMDFDDFGGYDEGNDSTWYSLAGRIGRLRYLSYGFFIVFLMYMLLFIVGGVMGAIGAGEGLVTFFAVILAIPFWVLSGFIYPIRRLNDLGHTGWLCLLGLVPLVNLILYLYLVFAPGNDGFNEYGAPPRENQWYHWVGSIILPFGFIAVIGILAAIALPAYQSYVEKAHEASIESAE